MARGRLVLGTFALLAGASMLVFALRPHAAGAARPAYTPPTRSAAEIRDLDIQFWETRALADPSGATNRAHLAALYLRRGRETGSFQDYARAERWSRESLAIREGHNQASYSLLVSALLARHAFGEARSVALALDSLDADDPARGAMLAEIDLELGRYREADSLFDRVRRVADRPSVAARVARWHELSGRLDRAEALLDGTIRRAASGATDLTSEQRAWFEYRRGEIQLKRGQRAGADSAFQRALGLFPQDYRAMGARARLALGDHRWRDAVLWGERTIAVQLDPATLGVLSDAYGALGDSAQSASYARAMRLSALAQPGPIHRAWGLFLLDRHEDVQRVLARARAEVRTRHDVYGYDLLAWALHAAGRDAEAVPLVRQALARGTEDAMLEFHAGMILLAAGESAEARTHLSRALARDAHFHHSHADEARRALASLGGTIATGGGK